MMKPVDLVERALDASSADGDRVLDPFGGSRSTVITAERTGLMASLVELDPRDCDVILARWEAFTGLRAERLSAIIAAA
jgi:DNA modification methylase